MNKVMVDRRELVAAHHRIEKMAAHLHKIACGAGRKINAAN